ncbi:unnamed protein product [Caenorhabditis auriculariae]|uniref:Uncharacterized protein n=1 Tax=Caenorhabditis auriculariae TaxID=2777116 RepID=A0A8S1HCH1_9PELO|nr:unnamed protein product [Caenorhabditis auriculariae]
MRGLRTAHRQTKTATVKYPYDHFANSGVVSAEATLGTLVKSGPYRGLPLSFGIPVLLLMSNSLFCTPADKSRSGFIKHSCTEQFTRPLDAIKLSTAQNPSRNRRDLARYRAAEPVSPKRSETRLLSERTTTDSFSKSGHDLKEGSTTGEEAQTVRIACASNRPRLRLVLTHKYHRPVSAIVAASRRLPLCATSRIRVAFLLSSPFAFSDRLLQTDRSSSRPCPSMSTITRCLGPW